MKVPRLYNLHHDYEDGTYIILRSKSNSTFKYYYVKSTKEVYYISKANNYRSILVENKDGNVPARDVTYIKTPDEILVLLWLAD